MAVGREVQRFPTDLNRARGEGTRAAFGMYFTPNPAFRPNPTISGARRTEPLWTRNPLCAMTGGLRCDGPPPSEARPREVRQLLGLSARLPSAGRIVGALRGGVECVRSIVEPQPSKCRRLPTTVEHPRCQRTSGRVGGSLPGPKRSAERSKLRSEYIALKRRLGTKGS